MRRGLRGLLSDLRALPRPVYLVLLIVAVYRTMSFVQFFVVLYGARIGLDVRSAGLLLTVYGGVSVAGLMLGGKLIEWAGPRRVMGVTLICSGLFAGTIPFIDDFALLIAACATAGLMSQVYRPAASTIIARLTADEYMVTASAGFRLAINLGTAIGPLLGAIVAGWSFTVLFELNLVAGVVVGLVVLTRLPEVAVAKPDPGGATRRAAPVLRDRRYLAFVFAVLIGAVLEVQFSSVLPLAISANGQPIVLYGALLTINAVLIILFELPLTAVTKLWSIRVAVVGGTAVMALGTGMFGLGDDAAVFVAAAVVWTVGEMVCSPPLLAYPPLMAPKELQSRYISVMWIFQGAGYAVGPFLGTALFQAFGSAVWFLLLAVGGLGAASALVGIRRTDVAEKNAVR